jgi:hypothetical protein
MPKSLDSEDLGFTPKWLQYKHLQHAFTSLTSDEVLELGTRMYTRNHHLNGPHKKHLVGKKFATDAERKQAVTSCLQTLGMVFSVHGDTSVGAMVGLMFKMSIAAM